MANGSGTQLPGIAAEQELVRQLQVLGYKIVVGERLDHALKLDGVITAPPVLAQAFFFPPPIGIQVTTRGGDWEKRTGFAQVARGVVPRLAYVELCDFEVVPEMVSATDAALRSLFYNKKSPGTALVEVGSNVYNISDLDALLAQYQTWLRTPIPGRIAGRIHTWRTDKNYGFASAQVAGPNGVVEETTFFVHLSSADDALTQRLAGVDGNTNIAVTFEDAPSDGEQKRKSATKVKLA